MPARVTRFRPETAITASRGISPGFLITRGKKNGNGPRMTRMRLRASFDSMQTLIRVIRVIRGLFPPILCLLCWRRAVFASSSSGVGVLFPHEQAPAHVDEPDDFHYEKNGQRFPGQAADKVTEKVRRDAHAKRVFRSVKDGRTS